MTMQTILAPFVAWASRPCIFVRQLLIENAWARRPCHVSYRTLTCPSLLLLLLATGCARYEYNIVQPPDLAAHIGSNTDQVVPRAPLEYRFRSYDNRLVIRIFNQSEDPISLIGERSIAVSPDGQSHPLRSQTIAPGSFIKIIFPPPEPRIYQPGPTFGIGVGTSVGHYHRHPHYHYHDPFPQDPRYFVVWEDADPTYYWDWDGQSEVSATFVFKGPKDEFKHDWRFRRQKM